MTSDNVLTEADLDRAVAGAWGRHDDAADPAVRQAFRDAGFDEVETSRGVAMLESGGFVSFEDAASSLAGAFDGSRLRRVSEGRIVEAGRRLSEQQTARNRPRQSGDSVTVTEADVERAVSETFGTARSTGSLPAAGSTPADMERAAQLRGNR